MAELADLTGSRPQLSTGTEIMAGLRHYDWLFSLIIGGGIGP